MFLRADSPLLGLAVEVWNQLAHDHFGLIDHCHLNASSSEEGFSSQFKPPGTLLVIEESNKYSDE
jgi:hypothetical protein